MILSMKYSSSEIPKQPFENRDPPLSCDDEKQKSKNVVGVSVNERDRWGEGNEKGEVRSYEVRWLGE